MKKKMNNKGFSLVELIIVIAIMAVLVGILAPQYLKYVNNSRVSTDVTNAQEMATAINVAVADHKTVFTGATSVDWTQTATTMATSKLGGTYTISGDNTNGVSGITLTVGSKVCEVYPDPDNTTDGANQVGVGFKQ